MGWIIGREHGRLARAGKKKLVLLAGLRATRAPVYRAKAGRWVAALCVVASALVLVPAAAAAPTTKFVSKQYGYSIVFPGGSSHWTSSFAFVRWSTGTISPGAPAFDTFRICGSTPPVANIGARRLLAGSTLAKWTAIFVSNRGSDCATRPSSLSSSTLSGAPARVLTWSCTDGYKAIGITALHAHRGYFMIVASRTTSSRTSDRTAFNAARDSFRFLSK